MAAKGKPVMVTGATGYVGGRLVPRLLAAGHPIRVLARDPARLSGRPWVDQVEMVKGDVLEPASLPMALDGVGTAYYLIHSMSGGEDFHARDLEAARNFSHAAKAAGVSRLIYLGGLGDPSADLSDHLRSRQQTGAALAEAGVPVTELRAAVIVGAGSASFEMIRNLTERIPIMICPQWVFTRVQPIAVDDVLTYLVRALEAPESAGRIIEIGGADVLTYGQMMTGYAEARGLQRLLIPVPVLTPRLSSYWVHWMTPIPASIARPLIEGLRNEVIVRDQSARELFPEVTPVDYRTGVERALANLEAGRVETAWTDALSTQAGSEPPVLLTTQEGMIIERRQREVAASTDLLFQSVQRIGGRWGWPYLDGLWRLRGEMDRLIGGVGFRRGRRDPEKLRVGDAVDFWRVEAVEAGEILRLRAEMKVPGRAWLQFDMEPMDEERSRLVQTAYFAPKGLTGLLYWYGLYPIHALIFAGMIRALSRRAEAWAANANRTSAPS